MLQNLLGTFVCPNINQSVPMYINTIRNNECIAPNVQCKGGTNPV